MAKDRRVRLSARPAPTVLSTADTSTEPREATPIRRQRRLDVAAAMLGRNLSDILTALLDEHVDPADAEKQAELERLLAS